MKQACEMKPNTKRRIASSKPHFHYGQLHFRILRWQKIEILFSITQCSREVTIGIVWPEKRNNKHQTSLKNCDRKAKHENSGLVWLTASLSLLHHWEYGYHLSHEMVESCLEDTRKIRALEEVGRMKGFRVNSVEIPVWLQTLEFLHTPPFSTSIHWRVHWRVKHLLWRHALEH